MELQSNGYQFNIFDGYRESFINSRSIRAKQYEYAKKTNAYYRIASRHKNSRNKNRHPTKPDDWNNESLYLEIDPNLSPDFNFTYVDLITEKSLCVNLIETEQRDWGRTTLILQVIYTGENQELFQNKNYEYVETIPGTIEKRLQLYKQAFDKVCQMYLASYFNEGFKVNRQHVIDNLANYIWFAHTAGRVTLCSWGGASEISRILLAFSVLSGHSLTEPNQTTYKSYNKLFSDNNYQIRDFMPLSIPDDQAQLLERIFKFRETNADAFQEAFSNNHGRTFGEPDYDLEALLIHFQQHGL
jgi:hypothetical protein